MAAWPMVILDSPTALDLTHGSRFYGRLMGARGETPATSRWPLQRALANRRFRRLLAAQTVSRWGDTFNSVALVILIFQLTGSGLGVAGVVVAEILPVLTLAPLAGVVIDRFPLVRVVIVGSIGNSGRQSVLPCGTALRPSST